MNEFVWVALCLFGAIGFVQCVFWLFSLRTPLRGTVRGYHVVPLYDNPATIEQRLRGALARLRWTSGGQVVLLVDMGLGTECLSVCETFIRQNPGLMLCRAAELDCALRDLDCMLNAQ